MDDCLGQLKSDIWFEFVCSYFRFEYLGHCKPQKTIVCEWPQDGKLVCFQALGRGPSGGFLIVACTDFLGDLIEIPYWRLFFVTHESPKWLEYKNLLKRDINVVLFPMLLSISKDLEETETSRTKCCTVLAAHCALPSNEDQSMLRNVRQKKEMVIIWMTSLLGADWNYMRGRINLGFLVRSCPTDQHHYNTYAQWWQRGQPMAPPSNG